METNFLYNVVKGLNIWTWTEGMTFSEKNPPKDYNIQQMNYLVRKTKVIKH